jgi:hypothetical protein
MAQVVVQHVGADTEGFRRFCGADQRRHRRDAIGQVIGQGQRVITEGLDLAGLLRKFGPRLRMPDAYTKPKRPHVQLTFRKASVLIFAGMIAKSNFPGSHFRIAHRAALQNFGNCATENPLD